MALFPPPVGSSASVSRPPVTAATASACPGRRLRWPRVSRAAARMAGRSRATTGEGSAIRGCRGASRCRACVARASRPTGTGGGRATGRRAASGPGRARGSGRQPAPGRARGGQGARGRQGASDGHRGLGRAGRSPRSAPSSVQRAPGLAASPPSCGTMRGRRRRSAGAGDGGGPMARYVVRLTDIDRADVELVGGKAANLGELMRVEGIRVPAGFCVTTHAFRRMIADAPSIEARLDALALVRPDDRETIRGLSAEIRGALERAAIPEDVETAISAALAQLDDRAAFAVRSSATAEDSTTSSFAGQHDTYLNVGRAAVVPHVGRCWASLFTEQAVTYRLRNRADPRAVAMAVVVQEMVRPDVAGVLFTADPVTGNRRVVSVEAAFGLGEALVSGLTSPDVYKVRDGEVGGATVGSKAVAVEASSAGGIVERAVEPRRRAERALSDDQVLRLAAIGRRIEAHFGRPQDIEWCLVDDEIEVVQSRPITTLFPIPESGDAAFHVYVSVGHGQMMTDAMKPLGLSV